MFLIFTGKHMLLFRVRTMDVSIVEIAAASSFDETLLCSLQTVHCGSEPGTSHFA